MSTFFTFYITPSQCPKDFKYHYMLNVTLNGRYFSNAFLKLLFGIQVSWYSICTCWKLICTLETYLVGTLRSLYMKPRGLNSVLRPITIVPRSHFRLWYQVSVLARRSMWFCVTLVVCPLSNVTSRSDFGIPLGLVHFTKAEMCVFGLWRGVHLPNALGPSKLELSRCPVSRGIPSTALIDVD